MATTFATALLRPVLEVAVKLDALLKKDAPHPALAGLPEVVVPLMSTALQAVDWWRTMTPPLDGWSVQDVRRGMDRLRELRAAVDHASSELLKRHAKDERFPAEMLHRMVKAHQVDAQERFATAVHDCLAALAAWKPRKHGGGAKQHHTLETYERVWDDWQGAKAQGIRQKEWCEGFYQGLGAELGMPPPPKGQRCSDASRLLDNARKRIGRRPRSRKE